MAARRTTLVIALALALVAWAPRSSRALDAEYDGDIDGAGVDDGDDFSWREESEGDDDPMEAWREMDGDPLGEWSMSQGGAGMGNGAGAPGTFGAEGGPGADGDMYAPGGTGDWMSGGDAEPPFGMEGGGAPPPGAMAMPSEGLTNSPGVPDELPPSPVLEELTAEETSARQGQDPKDAPAPLTGTQAFEEWLELDGTAAESVNARAAGLNAKFRLAFATPLLMLNMKDILAAAGLDKPGLDDDTPQLSLEALNARLVEHAILTREVILRNSNMEKAAAAVQEKHGVNVGGEGGGQPTPEMQAELMEMLADQEKVVGRRQWGDDTYSNEVQVFDVYQGHWPELAYSSPQAAALRVLVRAFKTALLEYYRVFGMPHAPVPAMNELNLKVWQSVHFNSSDHGYHDHVPSRACGIYYARIPEGAGTISFADPRGLRSPFMYSPIDIKPKEGDMIIFPPYLAHKVGPSPGVPYKHARVSYSFNEKPDNEGASEWTSGSEWSMLGAEAAGLPQDEAEAAEKLPDGPERRATSPWKVSGCGPCEWGYKKDQYAKPGSIR